MQTMRPNDDVGGFVRPVDDRRTWREGWYVPILILVEIVWLVHDLLRA